MEKTRKAALSAPKVSSDRAVDLMSYRDAVSRTESVESPRDLAAMLDRAMVTDDKHLAKAVLYRAYNRQDDATVQEYFRRTPRELPAFEEFMSAANEFNQLEETGLDLTVGVMAPEKPSELSVPGYATH